MDPIRLERVVSGGQTGIDQSALRAAKAAGLATGGWMPLGFRTEDGRRPDFESRYGMKPARTSEYRDRTHLNVRDSDATIWLGPTGSPGWIATSWAIREFGRPSMLVEPGETTPRMVLEFLAAHRVKVLNVAGPRESEVPGIGERGERFLGRLFHLIKTAPATDA